MKFSSFLFLLASVVFLGCAQEQAPPPPPVASMEVSTVDEEAAVVAIADRFSEAVATHDSTMAASVLSENVIIAEGGNIETRDVYLSGHFNGDAAFIGAMTREPISQKVTVSGDAAWMVSESRLHGTFRDREVDIISLGTLVLSRDGGPWKIVSVHWSSGTSH